MRAAAARRARGRRHRGRRRWPASPRAGARAGRRPCAGTGRRAARRDLHGHVRAAAGPVRAPARVDPRADATATGSASSATTARTRRASPRSRRAVAGDPRFVALALAARGSASTATSSARSRWRRRAAQYVALADQDDAWHPDKLETLLARARRRAARLQRRADRRSATARVIADTYWEQRAQQPLRPALAAGRQLRHRRGLAVPAPRCSTTRCRSRRRSSRTSTTTGSRSPRSSLGDIAFVDRPLYDYVQHGDASLGHAAANRMHGAARPPRPRCGATRASACGMWRMHYFVDVAGCCSSRPCCACAAATGWPAPKRRALERFLARRPLAARRWGACARAARASSLRRRPETLGAEWMLAYAFAWRRLLAATARDRPRARLRLDALPPPRARPQARAPRPRRAGRRAPIAEKVAPLELAVARRRARSASTCSSPRSTSSTSSGATSRKFNLARRLAARGAARADRHRRPGAAAAARLAAARSRPTSGLAGLFDQVEVAFAREAQRARGQPRRPLRRHHVVDARTSPAHAARALGGRPLPLPDPGVRAVHLPDGHLRGAGERVLPLPARRAVLDRAAARLLPPSRASASTRRAPRPGDARLGRLPERDHGGRAARPPRSSRQRADAPAALLRAPGAARGAQHVRARRARPRPRARAGRAGAAGSCTASAPSSGGRRIDLGGGAAWSCSPRTGQRAYARACCATTTSASRSCTRPHPSLVPIEMASAGMLTVTNSFENKTARGAGGDLAQPDHRRARRRGDRRGAGRGGGRRRRTSSAAPRGSAVQLEPRLGQLLRRRAPGARDRVGAGRR